MYVTPWLKFTNFHDCMHPVVFINGPFLRICFSNICVPLVIRFSQIILKYLENGGVFLSINF